MRIILGPWAKKLKFIYSEKATKFWKIFTLLLSYVVPVKSILIRWRFRKILWPSQNIWTLMYIAPPLLPPPPPRHHCCHRRRRATVEWLPKRRVLLLSLDSHGLSHKTVKRIHKVRFIFRRCTSVSISECFSCHQSCALLCTAARGHP